MRTCARTEAGRARRSDHTLPISDIAVGAGDCNALVVTASHDRSCKVGGIGSRSAAAPPRWVQALWRARGGPLLLTPPPPPLRAVCATAPAPGTHARPPCATSGPPQVWSVASGALLRSLPFPAPISAVALDAGEQRLYAAATSGTIYEVRCWGSGWPGWLALCGPAARPLRPLLGGPLAPLGSWERQAGGAGRRAGCTAHQPPGRLGAAHVGCSELQRQARHLPCTPRHRWT
jgi:hypothetical protein